MARKHSIKKETKTDYNAETGNISVTETEEHLIIDDTPHVFMADDAADDDDDLMFLGSKKKHSSLATDDDLDGEPALIIRVDDDGFW
jgi:photosystem II stability/assembly factor-like uncharacterized protein